jgi:hypothetical protein
MQTFGSYNEMVAGMGQSVQGTMSVFNTTEGRPQGRFEGGAFMALDNRRRLDAAFNNLTLWFVEASSMIGGFRRGCPELERAWLRLQELREDVNKVAVDLMPYG